MIYLVLFSIAAWAVASFVAASTKKGKNEG